MTDRVLSNAERVALRSAIRRHPKFATYTTASSINKPVKEWSKAELLTAAANLDIDVDATIEGTAEAPSAEHEAVDAIDVSLGDGGTPTTPIEMVAACELNDQQVEDAATQILARPLQERIPAVVDLVRKAHTPRVRHVEVERVVENVVYLNPDKTPASAATIANAAHNMLPSVIATKPASELFGITATVGTEAAVTVLDGLMIELWNDPTSPTIDPRYIFRPEELLQILLCIHPKQGQPQNAWLYGLAGTGKSSMVEQVAARLGRGFVRINMDGDMSRIDLFGGMRIVAGDTVWSDGVLPAAIRRPGVVVLLDEVTFARPANISALQAVLEPGGALVIPETGERVTKAPGVRMFAADNTAGSGDTVGVYHDTREMNAAFRDRFGAFIEFDYLEAKDEERLVRQATGLPKTATKMMVGLMTKSRAASKIGEMQVAPSLRRVVAWGQMLAGGMGVKAAYVTTVVRSLSKADGERAMQLYNSAIDEKAIVDALNNTTPQVGGTDALADQVLADQDDVEENPF